jgi:hypothetical protein
MHRQASPRTIDLVPRRPGDERVGGDAQKSLPPR